MYIFIFFQPCAFEKYFPRIEGKILICATDFPYHCSCAYIQIDDCIVLLIFLCSGITLMVLIFSCVFDAFFRFFSHVSLSCVTCFVFFENDYALW